MLAAAYHCCSDIELADYKGCYAMNSVETLKKLYSCLALYGFSLAEEEYISLMEGSHPLYTVKEELDEEKPEDDTTDDESAAKEEEILTTAEYSTEEETYSGIEEVQEEIRKFAG